MRFFVKLVFVYVILFMGVFLILDFLTAIAVANFDFKTRNELFSYSLTLQGVFEVILIFVFIILGFVLAGKKKMFFSGFTLFMASLFLTIKYFLLLLKFFLPSFLNSLPAFLRDSNLFYALFFVMLAILYLVFFFHFKNKGKNPYFLLGGMLVSIIASLFYFSIINIFDIMKIIDSLRVSSLFWNTLDVYLVKTLMFILPVLILFYYFTLLFTDEENRNVL